MWGRCTRRSTVPLSAHAPGTTTPARARPSTGTTARRPRTTLKTNLRSPSTPTGSSWKGQVLPPWPLFFGAGVPRLRGGRPPETELEPGTRPVGVGRVAGEGLGEADPGAGVVAVDHKVAVGGQAALGDDEGEVEGAARDPVGGVGRAPLPHRPVGGGELDPQRRRRRLQLPVPVAEGAGPYADVADVADPGGGGALHAEGGGYVLGGGPRLPDPGRDRGGGGPVGAVPRGPHTPRRGPGGRHEG